MKRSVLGTGVLALVLTCSSAACRREQPASEYRFDELTFLLNLDPSRVDIGERAGVDLRRSSIPGALLRRCNLGSEVRRTLRLRPGVEARFRDVVRPGAVLRFELGMLQKASANSAFECLVAAGPEGARQVLWSTRLDRRDFGELSSWQQVEVALAPHTAGDVVLSVRALDPTAALQNVDLPCWANPTVDAPNRVLPVAVAPARSFVIFLVDTLRADHLNVHGYGEETSPRVSELARQSLVLLQAHSVSSWTKASVASLFTSRYPSQHGAEDYQDRMKDSEVTLAELFEEAGYTTAAIGFQPFVFRTKYNLGQGFRDFYEVDTLYGTEAARADAVVDEAIDWITRHRDEPFLLYVMVVDPHEPYAPPPAELERFASPRYDGPLDGTLHGPGTHRNRKAWDLEDGDLEHLLALYDGEVAFTDAQVGRLIAHLRGLGLWPETTFVLTADHGEEFLDHDSWAHGQTLYQEQLHVPLLIKPPDWVELEPARIEAPVSLLDVAPTLCRLANIPIADAPFLGEDLTGLFLEPKRRDERSLLGELRKQGVVAYSIRRGDLKYVVGLPPKEYEAVYRLDEDPRERRSVIEELDPALVDMFRETVAQLQEARQEWGLIVEFLGDGTPVEIELEIRTPTEGCDFTLRQAENQDEGDWFLARTLADGVTELIEAELRLDGADRRDALVMRTNWDEPMTVRVRLDGAPMDPSRILLGSSAANPLDSAFVISPGVVELRVDEPPAWDGSLGTWCRIWLLEKEEAELDEHDLHILRDLGYVGHD